MNNLFSLWATDLKHVIFVDALLEMEKAMSRDKIEVNDRQLACARINSKEGQNYLKSMSAAANFAWVNRSSMTFLARQVCINIILIYYIQFLTDSYDILTNIILKAFAKQFKMTPDDLDMHVIYDVSHNIAKMEQHYVGGKLKHLLVHRKVLKTKLFNLCSYTCITYLYSIFLLYVIITL